jgi:nitrilase
MPQFHIAAVQAGSVLFDTPATLGRMEALCQRALEDNRGREGLDLLVFPEAFVGGYPKGLDFGARLGSRTAEGREDYLRYWRSAIAVPGEETARIGAMAAALRAWLVAGVIEKVGATLYCASLTFDPAGQLVNHHRKLMPTATERLVWAQGDGSGLGVVQTPMGVLGGAICWENYMPALRQAMYAKGVEIWCAPTVDEREIWQASLRHIAYEGRMFVVGACQYLTPADLPESYAAAVSDQPLIRGGSVIIGPMGDVLAGPVYGEEAIVSAVIDTEDIVRARYDLDVSGHYARPDLFTMMVDESPRQTVRCQNTTESVAPA